MREIQVSQITEVVAEMCMKACYYLPGDVYSAMVKARETEESPLGRDVLDQIIRNAEIAKAEDRPICQDTGMTVVFVEIGQDVHFVLTRRYRMRCGILCLKQTTLDNKGASP